MWYIWCYMTVIFRWYLNRRTPKFTYLLNKLFYHLFKRHFTISKPQPYSHFERPLLDAEAAYRVLFLLISFLALIFYGTLYPLCMYYIFIKSDVARTVLASMKKSGEWELYIATCTYVWTAPSRSHNLQHNRSVGDAYKSDYRYAKCRLYSNKWVVTKINRIAVSHL